MLMAFIIFFIIIQNQIIDVNDEKSQDVLTEVRKLIGKEVSLAQEASDGYSRIFSLPKTINGKQYSLLLNDSEIRISYSGKEIPIFLLPNITKYSLDVGLNRISKFNNEIRIVSSSGVCGNGIVESPNFNYVFEECDGAKDSLCPGKCNITTCFCPVY